MLLVEIDRPGQIPTVTELKTGQYRWHSLPDENLYGEDDVDALDGRLRALEGQHSRKLIDLKVRGALSLADMQYFKERIGEQAGAAFYCLRINSDDLQLPPTNEVLRDFAPPGVVGNAVNKFVEIIEQGGDDADLARDALYRLYVEYKRLERGQA